MWRWVSATALIAGAQDAPSDAVAGHTWPTLAHGVPISPSQPHTNPAHFVPLPRPHVAGESDADASSNWSGQLLTGTTFSGVQASWVVPAVQATQYSGASATWIGIDGAGTSSGSIIQTGTAQNTSGGVTSYFAWYELYPQPSVEIGPVTPGDSMSASIENAGGGNWDLSISDTTAGNQAGGLLQYGGPATSAEWIEELPTVVGAAQPTLANFGSVTFTDMTYNAVSPGAATLSPIDMIDESGNVIASAGATTFNGVSSSFTDTYEPTSQYPRPLGS
jgi:hypothetical protein